ncbi:response regulator [Brachybacterium hainanense]|uniref:Response regulator n=1 Tax=Brachybacterium hainanense TaxID=1541174 RepID=A0ABV6RAJ6_9MICO
MSIPVLICDDDPIVREALAMYLRSADDVDMIAAAGTAEEALSLLDGIAPQVVLMDLSMPGMGGLAGATAIRRDRPEISVLMLTTFGTDEQVREALALGAAGFLLKSAPAEALVAAVRAAAAGAGVVITPEVASALAREPAALAEGSAATAPAGAPPTSPPPAAPSPGPDGPGAAAPETTGAASPGEGPAAADPAADRPLPALTERELEVLHLLCRADTNTQIAAQLVLSESTVKKHVTSLMTKLGSASRLQIAVRAFELGLAEPPGPRA